LGGRGGHGGVLMLVCSCVESGVGFCERVACEWW
jgi:hypothetical protein